MADARGTVALCPLQPAVCCLPAAVLCRLPSSTSLPPAAVTKRCPESNDCPVTQVELDGWHFFLITTVLPIPPALAIPVVWLGRQDPRRTGLSTGREHGVKEVGW